MTVKYLSETRGEAQRDSTTFQEAADNFKNFTEAGFDDTKKLLHSGASITSNDIDELLPPGDYASGTFTIPNGKTWADYFEVIVLAKSIAGGAGFGAATSIIDSMETGSTSWELRVKTGSSTDYAQIAKASATTFTCSAVSNDVVHSVYGRRKAGVV